MTKVRLLLMAVVLSVAGLAQAKVYEIDPNHSEIGFKIRHFVSHVHGVFNQFKGSIDFNEKNVEKSKVSAEIQTESINTRNDRRDHHLRSADFFDAAHNPTITFTSTSVTAKDGKPVSVAGILTMHGVSKPVVLQVDYLGAQKDSKMGERIGFEASTTINRKDFGINWNKALDSGMMLGDDVDINLNIEAVVPQKE